MGLKEYFAAVRKWFWLIFAATTLAAGASYWTSHSMPLIYRASTTLMVGQVIEDRNPRAVDINTSFQLAYTYATLATRQPVLQATVIALGLPTNWAELRQRVQVNVVEGTQLIEVHVLDTDPYRAAATSDEIANQLILRSPTSPLTTEREAQRDWVEGQITYLKSNISTAETQISELEQELADAFSARQIQEIQTRIAALHAQIDTWQSNLGPLLSFTEGSSPNYLAIIEPAQIPIGPVGPNTKTNVALAAMVGLVLSVGAAIGLEYFDDTIKSLDDVVNSLQLTPLGSVTRISGKSYAEKLVSVRQPQSPSSEEYRTLRTNIQFSALNRPVKTLLVTSPQATEGKSITVANLAIVMAQAGLKTVLIDADLRRPVQHRIFEISNRNGLTAACLQEDATLNGHLQSTSVENLHVLTSGPLPPNPSELLSSDRIRDFIGKLRQEYDIVLFDSPPSLAVTDAAVLATLVDGVILVTDARHTRRGAALRAKENLLRVGANILGIIVNRMPKSTGYYYYYHSNNGRRK